jgi:hypothetical protein
VSNHDPDFSANKGCVWAPGLGILLIVLYRSCRPCRAASTSARNTNTGTALFCRSACPRKRATLRGDLAERLGRKPDASACLNCAPRFDGNLVTAVAIW